RQRLQSRLKPKAVSQWAPAATTDGRSLPVNLSVSDVARWIKSWRLHLMREVGSKVPWWQAPGSTHGPTDMAGTRAPKRANLAGLSSPLDAGGKRVTETDT